MRMILANLMTVLFFVLIGSLAKAHVTVTVDVPSNTTPNLAASYPSLSDAVTAVNGITAMSGPVVLTVAAGTEAAPAVGYAITNPLGTTADNTITFNTSRLVTITANGAITEGALTDPIFKLIGADYINISGFTMQENAGNTFPAAAGNATIRASGGTNLLVNDYVYLVTTVLGGNVNTPVTNVYHTADLNMDGTVRANGGTDPAVNDYTFLITTALGGNSNKVLTHNQ